MSSTEAQLSIPNINFFQKLIEQASLNTPSTALITSNINDLPFNNSYPFNSSNSINKLSLNTIIPPLPILNQTNYNQLYNTPDLFMYYSGKFFYL